jgi:hypothetical protein
LFCETFILTFEKVNPNNNRALGERRIKPENYGTRHHENFSFMCLLFKYNREIRYLSFLFPTFFTVSTSWKHVLLISLKIVSLAIEGFFRICKIKSYFL